MFSHYYDTKKPNILHLQNIDASVHLAIDCSKGLTVEDWTCNGTPYIVYDEARKENNKTYGVPILYPTPNRIKNNVFTFEGKNVPSLMHGALRHHPFVIETVQDTVESCSVYAYVNYTTESSLFTQFPYLSRLNVTVTLTQTSVRWDFKIDNLGQETLPYSLALHPFFVRYQGASFDANFTQVMEMDDACLPSGTFLPLETTGISMDGSTLVEALALDHVFCVGENPCAHIYYPEQKKCLTLTASKEFQRMVVFTPQEAPFFCLENQTSSTDCHNLYNQGEIDAANLQLVASGQSSETFVAFQISDL